MRGFVITIFWWLICSHAICDFALQSDSMARGKNRHNRTQPPPNAIYQPTWMYWLGAHSLIHGAGVALATGVWWLGLCEVIAHGTIDFLKCDNRYGIHTDQALHLTSKLVWLVIFGALK